MRYDLHDFVLYEGAWRRRLDMPLRKAAKCCTAAGAQENICNSGKRMGFKLQI